MLDIIVGGFYGDEGKGKIVSYLGFKDSPSIAVRTGSINAGHTVVYNNNKWKIRIIPSAFINKKVKLMIGPGGLTSIEQFLKEIKETETEDRIFMDYHTGIISEKDVIDERNDEYLMKVVGSTGQGVGYAEYRRILRIGKIAKDYKELSKYTVDVPTKIIEEIQKGDKVIAEGTQGTFLSLYHGDYPYVTSRNTTASGVLSEVGVGPKYVKQIIIVFKSFVTRVGNGPLEGELSEEEAKKLGIFETATVTGRSRRSALFNLKLAKKAIELNSATQIAITKLDAIFKNAYKIREYEKLPIEAKKWLDEIEEQLKVPVTLIGTGEDSLDVIDLRKEKIGDE